jgi:hypothetical protein
MMKKRDGCVGGFWVNGQCVKPHNTHCEEEGGKIFLKNGYVGCSSDPRDIEIANGLGA